MPTRKPKVPESADDKEQSERFIEAAREFGADKGGKKFERAFKKLVPPKSKRTKPKASST
jgi:hypothetical protein